MYFHLKKKDIFIWIVTFNYSLADFTLNIESIE